MGAVLTTADRAAAKSYRPKTVPILGVLPYVRRDPLQYFMQIALAGGPVVPLRLGPERIYFINDPDLFIHVAQENAANYRKSKFFKRLHPMLGEGIITSDGPTWQRQRRTSQPAFGGNALNRYRHDMAAATSAMLDRWESLNGQVVDVAQEMMHVTLDIALRTLVGARLPADDYGKVFHAVTEFLHVADKHIWAPIHLPIEVPTPSNNRYRKAVAALDDMFAIIMEQRRRNPPEEPDMLSRLIAEYSGGGRDSRLLRDVVVSTLLAAHETTAAALTWTFYMLSKYPGVAARVRDEITDAAGGAAPGIEAARELPYTRAVFEETIRLYPPIWTFSRDAIGDDVLGDVPISAGSTVMLCVYTMHHHPDHWHNPEGFEPERFLGNSGRAAYFPYGAGPRTCIGARFAQIEALIVLAMTLHRFRLEMMPGHRAEPEPMITLRPRGGMPMRILPAA